MPGTVGPAIIKQQYFIPRQSDEIIRVHFANKAKYTFGLKRKYCAPLQREDDIIKC